MRLTGRLLSIEDKPYSFKDNGATVEGSTTYLHVWEAGANTAHRVKVKGDDVAKIAHLQDGDAVDLIVNVQANQGGRGAYLTVTFAGEFEPASSPSLNVVGESY